MKSKSFYHIYLILLCLLGNHFLLSAQDDPCLNFSSSFTLNTQPNSLEVSFSNQSTGDYLGGTWYFGDGTDAPANVNPILHTYPSTGYYQVCLEIYSIWCYSQTCKWVRVPNDIPTCTADFSYQPNPNNPLVINFTDNSSFQFLNGNTAPSYIWNFGDDNTANTPNPTHQYTESGIYDVCLYIINNETACNDTICYPIPVAVPNCTAGFAYEQNVVNGSPTIIFTNQSTYLDNLGTANYLWEFDDSTTSTDTNPTHSFPAGQYEVCLTINVLDNAGGSVCTDSTCQTITINDCTAAFQYASNNEGLATFSDFSTSTAGNITAWSWDFGDGGAATAQNPTHQYTESGTYSVCLTISTDQDCTDTYCEDVPITINTCQANFTYAPNGANIVFTNASTASGGLVSYEWQFGDGTFSTATNTSHIYAEGEYQVCLTITTTAATNNTVLCTDSTCQTIIVGCNANFEANVNESGLANFTDQSTTTIGNIVAWAWDFGNGNTSNLSNPSIQYIEAGDYNVCLTITTDTQCSDDICQIITINLPECQPQFTYTINYNNDNEVVFTNLSPTPPNSVNVSYFWDLGDGSNSSETNPTHFYGTDTYQVCLTTTYSVTFNNDFVSVCTDSTCQTITIGSCAAAFQYTTTNTGFTSFSDFSTSTAGNITAWSWDFGDGGAATTQNPTHQYSENGTYLVCLDITTAEGCTSQYCENISITIANCNAEFSSNLTATGLANFTDQSTSNGTIIAWDWVFDNGLSSETQNPSTQYTQDGNYNVCLTINDSNECSDTHCENVPVDIPNCNALFDANIFFSNGIAGVTLTNNTIIAPAPTNTTFFWDLGDGTTSNIPSPTHTYPSGTYQICLTVNYAVPFANDLVTICSDSTCQTITIGSCNANFTSNSNFAGIANFTDQSTSTAGTITAWSWIFGDGSTATTQNPTHQYTASGTYNVCLAITTNTGCSDSFCSNITVNVPTCNADMTVNVNLTGFGITTTNTSTHSPATLPVDYLWEFGDGTTSTAFAPSHSYTTGGTYQVCLTQNVMSGNNLVCSDSTCQTITLGSCNANFTGNSNFLGLATFTDQSSSTAGTITAWSWIFGDGTSGNTQNPTHQYTASGTYNVCLAITTNTGCSDSFCSDITVNVPTCNADMTVNIGTAALDIFTTNTSTHSPATLPVDYLWEFGDGTTSTAFAPSHSYTTGGTYEVCLTQNVMSGNNLVCSDSTCQTITLGSCIANFTGNSNFLGLATFTNQSSSTAGTITAWSWIFGDGSTATTQNPTHQYTASGTYNVCLAITTNTGCSDSFCSDITVNVPTCNADMTVNVNLTGFGITTTNTSTHSPATLPVDYLWEFGDGTTSTAFAPSHSYTTGGTYEVCLTQNVMSGNNLVCSDSTCQTITLGSCNANFTGNSNFLGLATFTNQSSSTAGTITAWSWIFGDGTSGNTQNPTHQYTASGMYNVCLAITTNTGCSDSFCSNITINVPTCNADMTVNVNLTGLGITTTNTSTHSPATLPVNYLWEFGDGTTSTAFAPSHSYTTGGTYQVCLTQNVTFAGVIVCSDSTCQTITLGSCNANFTSSSNFLGLATFTDQSTSTAGTITAWSWIFGDGTSGNTQNPTHQYTASGTYNVCLAITTNTGCSDSFCSDITVNVPTCNADMTVNVNLTGFGITTTNTSTHSPATLPADYLWEFGDGTTSTAFAPSHSYTTGGTYQVCLTQNVTFAGVIICSDSTCQTITLGSCNANFTSNSNFEGIANFTDQSTSTAGTITAWSWIFGDGTSGNTQNPTHQYTASGTYNVCLAITTNTGCSDSFCSDITVNVPTCNANFLMIAEIGGFGITTTNTSTHSPATLPVDYLWEFGDGTTSTAFAPSHSYTTGGTYQVCLTQNVTFAGIIVCSDSTCQTITLGSCNSSWVYTDLSNGLIEFTDITITNAGNIVSWAWTFGDGTTDNTQNPMHQYTQEGTYQVCLTVATDMGCSSVWCDDIPIIFANCGADFSFVIGADNYTITTTNLSTYTPATATADYLWDFGDGTTSTLFEPNHTYTTGGTYQVCLIQNVVLNNSIVCTDQACTPVTIVGNCNADFTISAGQLPQDYVFVDTSSPDYGTIISWSWDLGDGNTSTEQFPYHHYDQAGIYTVCLSITNEYGCTATTCHDITVSTCSADFDYTYSYNVATNLLDVSFTSFANAAPNGIDSYIWNFGDGTTSNEANPIHAYAQGTYTVCLTITSGDCTITDCQNITIGDCQAFFIESVNGLTVNFDNQSWSQSSDIASWLWDFGDGTTSTDSAPADHTYPAVDATYTVCLSLVAFDNCTSTYCTNITITAPNTCTANYTFIANGTTVDFFDTSTASDPIVTWNWNYLGFVFSTEQNPTFDFGLPGSYDVTLNISTIDNCTSSITQTIVLDANCSAWFNHDGVGNNAVVFVDNSQSTGGESITDWTWSFGDGSGSSSNVNDPITHQYQQAGTYDVCLSITTDGGCQDTYCRMIIVGNPCDELFANFGASQVGTTLDMQFNNFSQGDVDDYLWNFGDGTFSTEASPLHTFAQYGNYNVCLTVSSDAGCSNQICEPYTLNPQIPPVVSEFQISPTLLFNPTEPLTIKIESPQAQSATVWIRAVNGQHIDVLERELTVGSNVITVEHRYLSPAMYVVSVILESGVSYNAKVIRF